MHQVEEVWRQDHLKDEKKDIIEGKDDQIDRKISENKLGCNSEQKDGNIYDSPDSGDSLHNIPDDLFHQKDKDHDDSGKIEFHQSISSPDLSSRFI